MRITAINRMLGEPQQTGAECSEEQGSCPSQLGSEELRNNNSVSINDNENMNGLRIVNLATKNDEA